LCYKPFNVSKLLETLHQLTGDQSEKNGSAP
jgi:hypothetical protein